jgi:hypothetical protein
MYITREILIRIAKETVEKTAFSDPGLLAAYLTGSLHSDNPFLGKATDIDIVFVHNGEPIIHREIIPLTPEIHLDIVHNPHKLYDRPKELRIHPWLGPEIYDPLPLYDPQHFFEFLQAGVRDRFHEPGNVQLRSRRLAENARQEWRKLQPIQTLGPEQVRIYLRSISLAANSVALLAGDPLTERRFLLQFAARARAAGQPGLAAGPLNLLGANQVDAALLAGFLPDWEESFLEAAGNPAVEKSISSFRLGYYKLAFKAVLAGETPQAILWPLLLTWTISACVLPPTRNIHWQSACVSLGLDAGSIGERMKELDHFLDSVEGIQERSANDLGQ